MKTSTLSQLKYWKITEYLNFSSEYKRNPVSVSDITHSKSLILTKTMTSSVITKTNSHF